MLSTLIDLPQDVFMTDLLPLLDPFSLCRLFQVNKALKSIVQTYIVHNKVVNMERVFNITKAFKFMTRHANGIRRLTLNYNGAGVFRLISSEQKSLLKGVIKSNPHLQNVKLIGVKMELSTWKLLEKLPVLKNLTFSPGCVPAKHKEYCKLIVQNLKERGCTVRYSHCEGETSEWESEDDWETDNSDMDSWVPCTCIACDSGSHYGWQPPPDWASDDEFDVDNENEGDWYENCDKTLWHQCTGICSVCATT